MGASGMHMAGDSVDTVMHPYKASDIQSCFQIPGKSNQEPILMNVNPFVVPTM